MEAYTSFAQVYDLFMDNVPYERWCEFIHEFLQKDGMDENIILDLACGTGKMTRLLAGKGYDMIGADSSAEMLDIARQQEAGYCIEIGEEEAEETEAGEADTGARTAAYLEELTGEEEAEETEAGEADTGEEENGDASAEEADTGEEEADGTEAGEADTGARTAAYLEELGMEEEYYDHAYEGPGSSTLYLCQDMRELELYGTIGACVCCCNSLNYILEETDLKKVFSLVNNYLYPGGLFIFDINSPYKYETLLADHTIAETRPEGSFIWDNYYDKDNGINEYDLTLFIREDLLTEEEETGENLPYYRFQETHFQRCYAIETIRRLLEEAGMEFVAAYDNYTGNPVTDCSEIITVIAREKGKTKAGPEK